MASERLDQLLVQRNLCESREKAQRLIRAGQVLVDGHPSGKPGHRVPVDCAIELKATDRFVSRGGLKLQAAFEHFPLDVTGQVAVDVGASTGGFTDCLLQHGAARVYAVDVGKGQLHWKLRQDDRVEILDRTNARNLVPGQFEMAPSVAVVDASFISLTKLLPALDRVVTRPGTVVTLIKPQFEAGRKDVGKGGVVRDDAIRQRVVNEIRQFGTESLRWHWQGAHESPIRGPAGNVEYVAVWILE